MKIKKGDSVKVLSGKDRGKNGKVLRAVPVANKVVVEGINVVKKHQKATKSGAKGQRITVPMPMNVSNLQLVCPKCGKPTRVGYKLTQDKKLRICKKCNTEI